MVDEDVFSLDRFRQLKAIFTGLPPPRLIGMMAVVLPAILFGSKLFLMLLGISVGLVFNSRSTKRQISACCLTWLISMAVMVMLLSTLKLPPRVIIPAGTACCVLTLLICNCRAAVDAAGATEKQPDSSAGTDRLFPQVWLGVMALCGAFVSCQHVASTSETVRIRRNLDDTIESLVERGDPLQVLLVPFPFPFLDPLQTQNNLADWRFIYLDGHQRSPRQMSIIRRHLHQPLTDAILEDRELRLVVEPQSRSLKSIRQFYRLHYGLDVRFPVDERLPWGTVRRVVYRPLKASAGNEDEPQNQAAAVDVSGN